MEVIRTIREFWEEKIGCSEEAKYELVCEQLNIEIGNRIRTIREAINFSQDEFGMLLGLSQAEVSYLENGVRELSSAKLYILNMFLSFRDMNELFELFLLADDSLSMRLSAIYPNLNKKGIEFLDHQLSYLESNPFFHREQYQ